MHGSEGNKIQGQKRYKLRLGGMGALHLYKQNRVRSGANANHII
jgi:hypothetical protein